MGIGVTVGVAGCSGDENSSPNAEDSDESTTSDEGTSTDSGTQTEQSTDTESTTEQEQTETSTETSSGDTVHNGEEELEVFINENEEDVPYGPWIEFEEPENQIETPLDYFGDSFNNMVSSGQDSIGEFDTMYVVLGSDGSTHAYSLHTNMWEGDNSALENMRSAIGGYNGLASYDEELLNSMFSEDIQDYNDASSDFPQEYLDLIEE